MADLEVQNNAKYMRRLARLKLERESYISHWKKITDNLLPRSGRYFLQDRNKGERRNLDILDSTGTRALGILAAGMMAGMSSPARKWFKLALPDRDLMGFHPVRIWLDETASVLRDVFARSNTYRVLHGLYEEMGAFGSGCAMLFRDQKDLIRLYPHTVGEFFLGQSNRSTVDTVYREFEMQTGPIVNEFGYDNEVTNALLKALKGRVQGMNVVGFFLAGSGRKGVVSRNTWFHILRGGDVTTEHAMDKMRKDKVVMLDSKGYDQYFILPGGGALSVENGGLDDDLTGASKATLKTAFAKSNKGRIQSRVLLNKFVALVA